MDRFARLWRRDAVVAGAHPTNEGIVAAVPGHAPGLDQATAMGTQHIIIAGSSNGDIWARLLAVIGQIT